MGNDAVARSHQTRHSLCITLTCNVRAQYSRLCRRMNECMSRLVKRFSFRATGNVDFASLTCVPLRYTDAAKRALLPLVAGTLQSRYTGRSIEIRPVSPVLYLCLSFSKHSVCNAHSCGVHSKFAGLVTFVSSSSSRIIAIAYSPTMAIASCPLVCSLAVLGVLCFSFVAYSDLGRLLR